MIVSLNEIAEKLKEWDNFAVVSHASPDGDTFGSASALMRLLNKLGKKVSFLCADPITPKFGFLFEGIRVSKETPKRIITVDVADVKLLGKLRPLLEGKIDMAIDHHGSHVPLAPIEYVEADSASNTEIIFELFKLMNVEIDQLTADCLYTGLSTDTSCFKYGNTTPRSHRIAAELMNLGARADEINYEMLTVKTKQQLEAEVRAVSGMEYYDDDRIALLTVSRELMDDLGLGDEDIDVLSAKPRQIEGVLVGITMKEKEDGHYKVSVRTNRTVNAADICGKIGGGGHAGAAGAEIFETDYQTAKAIILKAAMDYLKEQSL